MPFYFFELFVQTQTIQYVTNWSFSYYKEKESDRLVQLSSLTV